MDQTLIQAAIEGLEIKRREIEKHIESLRGMLDGTTKTVKKREWTPAMRKAASERIKARWAARKAAGKSLVQSPRAGKKSVAKKR